MQIHHLVVSAGIGGLHAIPVWRSLMIGGIRIGSWKVHVDRTRNVESLSIDVILLQDGGLDALRQRLRSGLLPNMSIVLR